MDPFPIVKWAYDIGGPWAIILVILCAVIYGCYRIIKALYDDNKELRTSNKNYFERVLVLGTAMVESTKAGLDKNKEQTEAIRALTETVNRNAPK